MTLDTRIWGYASMALDENFFADSPLVALLVDPDPSELDLIPDVPPFLRQRAATHNPPAPLRATSRSSADAPKRTFQVGVVRNGELRLAIPKTANGVG